MARVTKKNIEIIFDKIYENFTEFDYGLKREMLQYIENKSKVYNGENMSDKKAIEIAFEKIKYHFARIYAEGKSKKTLVNLKRYIDYVEQGYEYIGQEYNQRETVIFKDLITYLEISLNLDVSFPTSLLNIYEYCKEKDNLSFGRIIANSERGNIR